MATKKPIHTIRCGNLEAAVWENDSTNGRFRRITFARTYRNRDGKVASSTSFGVRELPALALLIGQSEAWLREAEGTEEVADQSAEEVGDIVR